MRVLTFSVLAALLLATLPAPAQAAQEGDYTLWLHKGASLFMSDDPADPGNDDSRQYCNFSCWAGGSHSTTWTSAPMATDLWFRPDDTAHVEVRIGDYGGWFATWGTLDVSVTIKADGETIASGAAQTVDFAPGQSYWETLVWDVVPDTQGIAAGQSVAITIVTTGQASGYVIGSRDADGRSLIRFPGAVAASEPEQAPVYEDLVSTTMAHQFANATSDTYHLNFTTDLVNSTANFAWNATAGSVNATLRDGNATVLYNGTFQSNGSIAHVITNAVAGEWNLTLAYHGFAGNFSFSLGPAGDHGADAGNDEGHADGSGGNTTQSLDDTPGQDSPLPAVIPLAAIMAAIAWRRRPEA